jgi:hypothetical protein
MTSKLQFYLLVFVVILLGLTFDPEDGGIMFIPYVSPFQTDYTALCPRLQNATPSEDHLLILPYADDKVRLKTLGKILNVRTKKCESVLFAIMLFFLNRTGLISTGVMVWQYL